MSKTIDYKELAVRYGLDPIPDSVIRLTQLLSKQDADLEEIARVISADPDLTVRLLRVANPRATNDQEFTIETVEEALMRTGVGCVLLLAMGAPLTAAILKTFQTMAGIQVRSVHPRSLPPLRGEHICGSIGFSGKAEGMIELRMIRPVAQRVAAAVLGLPEKELTDPTAVADTIGELLNIVTGNFKSNLCDAGLDCRIQPPKVHYANEVTPPPASAGGVERMAFRGPNVELFVTMVVNPWAD
ncbi:MAG: chemotaxis protein CheX [Verrucomicrobiota bacterium]|nr:chemotaxis protein CheX [Limisphaera sp.]MDW8380897.1 chemotaxis protein CheX [Verrucomicrobiota bacterium]